MEVIPYLLGVVVQYFKSLPFSGRWKSAQPVVSLLVLVVLSVVGYMATTKGAAHELATDWRAFLDASWAWAGKTALSTMVTGVVAQSAVNSGRVMADNPLIPVSNK